MTNCVQCDVLMPELDRQISNLKSENAALKSFQGALSEQLGQFEMVLFRALKLLQYAEPTGDIYVDTQKRGAWRKEQKELLKALVEE